MTGNERELHGISNDAIDKLRELRQLNIDSAKGFEQCVGLIHDDRLKALFREIAHERREQAQVLATRIEWGASVEEEEGSYLGALHRAWINIREACSADNLDAVLSEVGRGEAVICEAYDDAVQSTKKTAIGRTLARHRDVVLQQNGQITQLQQGNAGWQAG